MTGGNSREIILKVAFSLIIFSSLGQGAIYLCIMVPLKNIAVYEGDLNTLINFPASHNGVKWTTIATTDELTTVTLVNYDDTVNPSYTADYAFNSSGLTIKKATTKVEPGHQLSTAGLYTVECSGSQSSVKVLVVRRSPTCSCTKLDVTSIKVTCSSIYADSTNDSIEAIFTLYDADGNNIASSTPQRTNNDAYTWISIATFTIAYRTSSTYECGLTFGQPTEVQDPNIAMNSPNFNHSCSVATIACGEPIATSSSSSTTVTATTTSTTVECKDLDSNCDPQPGQYGWPPSYCTHDDYGPQVREKCPKMCNTCQPYSTDTTTTPTSTAAGNLSGSAYDQCFTYLRNTVVYEGTLNTMLNCATGPNSTTWSIKPTSNAGVYYEVTSYNDVVSQNLTGLYAINQTGLIVRNATTIPTDGPISTAGIYLIEFANGTNYMYTGIKLVVIRSGPNCFCIQSSSVNVISCTLIYADQATGSINAVMNCTANDGQFYASTTPTKTLLPYTPTEYVYNSTSTITVSNTGSAIFDCLVTFTAPTPHDPSYLATNAPDFNATSTVYCGTVTTSQTLTTQSPTTTMATTTFRFSMEPLFGPVAGGTKITVISSSTFEYLSKYVGFNVTGFRNVYIGKDLSSTTVSLLTIGSATFEYVAVTPNTTEASVGQHLPIIIEFSPTPFNMTFNTTFTYLPNPGITDIYPNIFIASGGTLLDVTGRSLSSVAKPIIQLTVVITRTAENNSSSTTSTTSTSRVCTVPKGNDTYMQCPMPPLNLPNDFLEILNSLYNTSTSRRRRSRKPVNQFITNSHSLLSRLKRDFSRNCVLSVNGPNGTDRADICLGISFDGYKEYENINDRLPDTKFIFYSAPEINKSSEVIEFDPSAEEFIYVKGRYMLRGCLLRDYLVHIGNQICINDNLTDNQLSCRPPKEKPSSIGNDSLHCGQHLSITVTVGYKLYQYACLTYPDNSKIFALIVGLTVGLAGFVIFLAILIACIVRCRIKKVNQENERHQNSGRQELRNRHHNNDVQPESRHDYIYTRENTISLYKPNDEYSTSVDEFHSSS